MRTRSRKVTLDKKTKKVRGSRSDRRKKSQLRRPTTARQYFSMSAKQQETWDSVGQVVSRMRDGISLLKASSEFRLDPAVVIRLGRSAIRRRKNGRYVAKKTDKLLRVVNVLTAGGRKEIATRDSRQSSLVGGHWAAVQKFLQTGDDSALLKFDKKKIVDASRKRFVLLTDLNELERLGSAGVLSFESLYAGGTR